VTKARALLAGDRRDHPYPHGQHAACYAGPAEVALLSNYIGEWSGSGVLQGGEKPEPFTCRLTVDKGNQAKINYAGGCTLVNMNLSGEPAPSPTTTRREPTRAIMAPTPDTKGVAVRAGAGRQDHPSTSPEKEADRAGHPCASGLVSFSSARARLRWITRSSSTIRPVLSATVPFAK